jgi:hypothetical protein
MASTIYVVKGLGLGDDDEQYENMKAFSSKQDAIEFVATVTKEFLTDSDGDYAGEFMISPLELD